MESGRRATDLGAGAGLALPPAQRGFVPGRSDRKIERSIGLELEMPVDEMARVAEQVTTVTNRHGGFVLSSSVSTGEDSAGGDFELRIPATRLRPALRDLAALADVRTQSQSGRDVTREHVTAKDRLQAARAERRSLLRRLEIAATDEEAEALRRQLDLVAGEINGLRGQLRSLRLRTDYAVVSVSLLPEDGDDGGGGAGGSFDDALGDAGDLLVAVAGVIVRVLAVALPIGLLVLLGWLAGRAVVRRRQRESALAYAVPILVVVPGVTATHFTDPACPWAYSARPAHARLRWRFGDQIEWRLVLIGLSESAEAYERRGYTPDRLVGTQHRVLEALRHAVQLRAQAPDVRHGARLPRGRRGSRARPRPRRGRAPSASAAPVHDAAAARRRRRPARGAGDSPGPGRRRDRRSHRRPRTSSPLYEAGPCARALRRRLAHARAGPLLDERRAGALHRARR